MYRVWWSERIHGAEHYGKEILELKSSVITGPLSIAQSGQEWASQAEEKSSPLRKLVCTNTVKGSLSQGWAVPQIPRKVQATDKKAAEENNSNIRNKDPPAFGVGFTVLGINASDQSVDGTMLCWFTMQQIKQLKKQPAFLI